MKVDNLKVLGSDGTYNIKASAINKKSRVGHLQSRIASSKAGESSSSVNMPSGGLRMAAIAITDGAKFNQEQSEEQKVNLEKVVMDSDEDSDDDDDSDDDYDSDDDSDSDEKTKKPKKTAEKNEKP
jgi:hypothetical protein